MHDNYGLPAQLDLNHLRLAQFRQRKGFARAHHVQAQNHGMRREPRVDAQHPFGRGRLVGHADTDHGVYFRNALSITGQRFQHQGIWMQALPLPPIRQQKWIQVQTLPPQGARDCLEAGLLPAAACLTIAKNFVSAHHTRIVEFQRLAIHGGPEHEGRVAE